MEKIFPTHEIVWKEIYGFNKLADCKTNVIPSDQEGVAVQVSVHSGKEEYRYRVRFNKVSGVGCLTAMRLVDGEIEDKKPSFFLDNHNMQAAGRFINQQSRMLSPECQWCEITEQGIRDEYPSAFERLSYRQKNSC